MKKINHEERWSLIRKVGKKETARLLGVQLQSLNSTIRKYKDWVPELKFEEEIMPVTEADINNPLNIRPLEDQTKIERVTQELYDERFYLHTEKINPRTGNHYFPSFSFIHSQGAPSSSFLSDWYRDKGWHSEVIFRRRQESGSYIHDCIDRMIKNGAAITEEEIDLRIPHSANEVKYALLGFMNWVEEYQPQIVASEHMVVSEELCIGGTIDLVARINKDDYKKEYTIDFKTSKSIFLEHRMQVEVYRRIQGSDECAILQLGAQNKKRFTFSQVTEKDKNEQFELWKCIRDTAYCVLISEGWISPKENPFPKEFKFKMFNHETT